MMTQETVYNNDTLIFPWNNVYHYITKVHDYLLSKGFSPADMPTLQNADKILDSVGERSRSELFFVENIDKEANALRYDFTLPIALYYLEHTQEGQRPECKIVTHGTVFRRRETEDTRTSEFKQIGIEYIGHTERTKTDAECLATILDLLSDIQKNHALNIEISDIGLSRAICDMPAIPPIKAGRLRSALLHREKFMRLLRQKKSDTMSNSLIALGDLHNTDAERIVNDIFKLTGLHHTGLRNPAEITHRFVKKSEEYHEPDIDNHLATLLSRFYDLECRAEVAADKIRSLLSEINPNIDDYLHYYQRRLDMMKGFGVDISQLHYGSLVNRKPEYYSGFMFSVNLKQSHDTAISVAGGGRYDDLFKVLGTSEKIPAVGAEIRPEEIVKLL
jgi:ATP phosphoribosyltransferase regulatory subunit